MKSELILVAMTCMLACVAAAAFHKRSSDFQEDTPYTLETGPSEGADIPDLATWLRYALHRSNSGLKRSYEKRNNGVWIWMPAQGYVPVPKDQINGNGSQGKNGKIMRYGRR